MVNKKSLLLTVCLFGSLFRLHGQASYSLDAAIADSRIHSPSAAIATIADREKELRNKNADSKTLPQVTLGGQATYQSETTGLDISFPGVNVPRLSRDQYKVQADLSQSVWDGGLVRAQKNLNTTSAAIESAQADTELESVTEQVIQTYFGILEADAGAAILKLKAKDLEAAKKRLESGVSNGAVLRSELRKLEAEELTLRQREAETLSIRKKMVESLGILTGRDLASGTVLEIPVTKQLDDENFGSKPAFRLFALQEVQIDNARKADLALGRPKLFLFGQAGYGKPGLNFLKNGFDTYYLGGLRLQWNLSNLYTNNREQQITTIQKEKTGVKKQNYDRQLRIRMTGLKADIDRLSEVLAADSEIIGLRTEIKKSAAVMYENGAKAIAEYIDVINDENEAMLTKEVHRLQHLKAIYLYNLTAGSR